MSKSRVFSHRGPGIVLELNTNDPHTPALVKTIRKPVATATFDCATTEGELYSSTVGNLYLTDEQLEWLAQYEDEVEAAYNEARKDHPDYA